MTLLSRSVRLACVAAAGSLAFAGVANAEEPGYTYVEAGYVTIDLDDPIDSLDAFTLGGSLAVTDRVHLFATYLDGDADADVFGSSFSVDTTQWTVGGGLNLPIAAGTDFVGRLAYVKVEAEAFGFSEDGDGYSLSAGLRARKAAWELEGFVVYEDIEDEDDTRVDLGARWFFTDAFSVGGLATLGENTGFGVNLRYEFQ